MTRLSVNINKIALLRNSRGGQVPNVLTVAQDCERFGADGITVHPRPDERHITYEDVRLLKPLLTTEFNIEGNPKEQKFIDLVLEVIPAQVTLVPDSQNQLTSNHGWDTVAERSFLSEMTILFKQHGIRTSIFVDPDIKMVIGAATIGADRIELYTEEYARGFATNPTKSVAAYKAAASQAEQGGLGINAGHDLNLVNLSYFATELPNLEEVSIGHALVADSLYYGLENTIQMYKRKLTIQSQQNYSN